MKWIIIWHITSYGSKSGRSIEKSFQENFTGSDIEVVTYTNNIVDGYDSVNIRKYVHQIVPLPPDIPFAESLTGE